MNSQRCISNTMKPTRQATSSLPAMRFELLERRLLLSVAPGVGSPEAGLLGQAAVMSGNAGAAQISGALWRDRDSDTALDAGEEPLAGWTVYLDINDSGDWDDAGQSDPIIFNSSDVPQPIEDLETAYSQLTVAGLGYPVTDVDVTLNITHFWTEDVCVCLTSPTGTRVQLFSDLGVTGDWSEDFTDTTLDDQADTPITSGRAPYTGRFSPEGSLSDFNGADANGVWTLEVYDDSIMEMGTLTGWSITIRTAAPEPSAVTDAQGHYTLVVSEAAAPAGSYPLRQVPRAGWQSTLPQAGWRIVQIVAGAVIDQADLPNRKPAKIAVHRGAVELVDGQTDPIDFGDIHTCQGSSQITFDVVNEGDLPLTLGDITLPDGYSLIDPPTGVLSRNGKAGDRNTFTIGMDNTVIGAKTGSVTIQHSDANNNPFEFTVHGRVWSFGDCNRDGQITATDVDMLWPQFGATVPPAEPRFDITGDGVVTIDDACHLVESTVGTSMADTNLDGRVDIFDLGNMADTWGKPGTFCNGDVNGDHKVDFQDLARLVSDYRKTSNAAAAAAAATDASVRVETATVPKPAPLPAVSDTQADPTPLEEPLTVRLSQEPATTQTRSLHPVRISTMLPLQAAPGLPSVKTITPLGRSRTDRRRVRLARSTDAHRWAEIRRSRPGGRRSAWAAMPSPDSPVGPRVRINPGPQGTSIVPDGSLHIHSKGQTR